MSQPGCFKKRKGFAFIQDVIVEGDYCNNTKPEIPELVHKIEFDIPFQLQDNEYSFVKWYNHVKVNLPLTNYKHLIKTLCINENDDDYINKLQ